MIKPSFFIFLRAFISYFLFSFQNDNIHAREVQPETLKTVYIIQISEFTIWPDEKMQASDEFLICIHPNSKLTPSLEQINGRLVKEKTLKIQSSLEKELLKNCHIFYVSPEDFDLFQQYQPILEKNSVLTFSSEETFSQEGIIEYYITQHQKLKMKVNLKSLERSQLRISTQLLRLMDIVNY